MQTSPSDIARMALPKGIALPAPPPKTSEGTETPEEKEQQAKLDFKRKYAPHASHDAQNWGDAESDAWLRKKHWSDTPWGRYAIEFVSRMTLGALMFSWMENSEASASMRNYSPNTYDAKTATWLQKVAKFTDDTVGKTLKFGLTKVYSEEKANQILTFRETRPQGNTGEMGRSIGAEMTVVTGSFAAMSVGSGIMRNILLGIFNPTERSGWLKNGSFDLLHTVKRTLSKAWEIVTYNAGEDAAVALPYVFYMRAQRNWLDKVYPGFRYGSDLVDNGGSFRVDSKGEVLDQQVWAGFWDIEGRFTVYNIFTQMYRDAYDKAGEILKKWKDNSFALKTPDFVKNPTIIPGKVIETTKGTVRYMAISTIRSLLQMLPTVPWFSLFRIPPNRLNGLAVNAEKGVLAFKIQGANGKDSFIPVRADQHIGTAFHGFYKNSDIELYWIKGNEPPVLAKYTRDGKEYSVRNTFMERDNKEEQVAFGFSGENRRLHHSITARFTDWLGQSLIGIAGHSMWEKGSRWFWNLVGVKETDTLSREENITRHTRSAVLAGIPYAFYFAEKVRRRETYVNEQMNMAIGRMVDGFLSLNWREIQEGRLEISRTLKGLPLEKSDRQAELIENHLYHPTDKSPMPENWSQSLHRQYIEEAKKGQEPSTLELTAIISQRRADKYGKQAELEKRNAGMTSKPELKEGEKLAAALMKQKITGWTDSPFASVDEHQLATV